MEAVQEATRAEEVTAAVEAPPQGPTAKEMAAIEEANAAKAKAASDKMQESAEPYEPPSLINLAAQGYDQLHEALRQHNLHNQPKEYVPPARTERQMSQLEAEMEAGRRSVARAEEARRLQAMVKEDLNKEGFTTPVYRPNNMVPDPMTGGMGPITEK